LARVRAVLLLALLLAAPAGAQTTGACTVPAGEWSLTSLAAVGQPMQHPLGGRLPLLIWNYPLTLAAALISAHADGSLARQLKLAADRGLALPVQVGWCNDGADALAEAEATRDAGLPLYLCLDQMPGGNAGLYGGTKLFPLGPWAGHPHVHRWPCLPLANPSVAAAGDRALMEQYRAAGLTVAGVFYDFEGFPHPWNGVYDAQRTCPRCAAHYPPGALDSEENFIRYVYDLRSRVLSVAMADPVLAVFPHALVGNYDEWVSTARVPYLDNGGAALPPRTLGRLNAIMPRVYASAWYLHQFFPELTPQPPSRGGRGGGGKAAGTPVSQEQADPIYFNLLLNTISTTNANKQPGQVSVPFLAREDPFDPLQTGGQRFGPGMSHAYYRELVWHALLRGTDGFYLYALGMPNSGVPAGEAWATIEDTRAVYDRVLGYRDLLDHGQVLSYQRHDPRYRGAVWSGLRGQDRCLLRVFHVGPGEARVRVEAFPGRWVTLTAGQPGASYLVDRRGKAERVAE
jgi:hypothetical protein